MTQRPRWSPRRSGGLSVAAPDHGPNGLIDRLVEAANSGQACEVTPAEMQWLLTDARKVEDPDRSRLDNLVLRSGRLVVEWGSEVALVVVAPPGDPEADAVEAYSQGNSPSFDGGRRGD